MPDSYIEEAPEIKEDSAIVSNSIERILSTKFSLDHRHAKARSSPDYV